MDKLGGILIILAELIVFLAISFIAFVTWSLITLILYAIFVVLWNNRKVIYKKLKK